MRKFIVIVLLFILRSEKAASQFRMGVIASPLITTNTLNNTEIGEINDSSECLYCGIKRVKTNPSFSYSVGFTMDYILSEEFYVSAKTIFAWKGWNERVHYTDFYPTNTATFYYSKDKYRFKYLEFPVSLVFSPSIGNKNNKFLLGMGGYINFALQGTYHFHLVKDTLYNPGRIDEEGLPDAINDSSASIAINSLQKKWIPFSANSIDIGATFLMGIELGDKIHFELTFSDGLRNIITSGFYPYLRTNRMIGLGLNVGYYIDSKTK
jgi:hypothetical protein